MRPLTRQPFLLGQGTIGLEILEQVPDVEAIVVPVGGAGLIAGIALVIKTLRPDVKIIAVESTRCPSFHAAMEAGKPVSVEVGSTLADGLAVPRVGPIAFKAAQHRVDRVVLVPERFIALAILRLTELDRSIVEGKLVPQASLFQSTLIFSAFYALVTRGRRMRFGGFVV